jgi:hypothetical protein
MNTPERGVAGLPPVDGEPAGWIVWSAALAAISAGLYLLLLGVGADLSSPAKWRIATFVVAEAVVVIAATLKARSVWVFVGVPIVVFGCFRVLADMAVEPGDSQSGLERLAP